MNAKPDRRRQRTEHWLGDALVELTLEKGYEAVTIRDIAERADVAYITFFRHFHSKDDLLMSMLDSAIAEMSGTDEASSQFPLDERALVLWFRHILDHQTFLRALLRALPLRRTWKNRLAASIQRTLEQTHDPRSGSYVPVGLAANVIAASIMEFMDWWFEQETTYTPEYLARTFQQLVVLPILSMHFEE